MKQPTAAATRVAYAPGLADIPALVLLMSARFGTDQLFEVKGVSAGLLRYARR